MIKVLQIGAENFGKGGRSVIAFGLTKYMPKDIRNDFVAYSSYEENIVTNQIVQQGKIIKIFTRKINRTFQLMKEEQYDIVHIHADHAYEAMKNAYIAKKAGIKTVIIHAHSAGGNKYGFLKRMVIMLCKLTLWKYSDVMIACTEDAAKYMYRKKDLKKIIIIKDGIETKNFKYDFNKKIEKRRELSISDEFVIGNVGRLAYPKNQEFLIEMFSIFQRYNKNSKLLFIGDGQDRQKLNEKMKKKNLEEKIIFLGNRYDIPELLQCMDVFVFPSVREGFGMAALEAQATGLPTIMSENVPIDVLVSSNSVRLPIIDPQVWVEKLKYLQNVKFDRDKKSAETILKITEEGYELTMSSKRLENIYRSKADAN